MIVPALNIVESVDLTPKDCLLPLFESLINSIISLIKTDIPLKDKLIEVRIIRGDIPQQLNTNNIKTIKSIIISDNGIGFDEENYDSFETPFTKINKEFGCKGIGRFTALAAFKKLKICSNYIENDKWKYREFEFEAEKEVIPIRFEDSISQESKTVVELIECFNPVIKDKTAIDILEIAHQIMQHCLVYYLNDQLPKIKLTDSDFKKTIVINDLFSKVSKEKEKSFDVRDNTFKAYITKTPKEGNRKFHYVYYCANSRVVGEPINIGKLNSLFSYPLMQNGHQNFLDVYVVSDYLNNRVLNIRNGFTIPQEKLGDIFEKDDQISFQEIEEELVKLLEGQYESHVIETKEESLKQLRHYIENQAPRFKSLLKNPEALNTIPPNLPDDKKEEHLYRISFNARKNVERHLQEFIDNKQITEEAIRAIKNDIQSKAAYDSDSLADYMTRRKAVLGLFDKFLEADKEGKYKLEQDIHNLIFPMGITGDEVDYESHNLWLLDERFVTYKFIGSDKSITSVSQKKSSKEPDLLILDEKPIMFDNPISFGDKSNGTLSSMVIFEFKRPGETAHQKNKTDYRWEFSDLLQPYFDDFLYSPDKKNYKGKNVVLTKETPKFGYIILDVIPPALKEYNLNNGWYETPFGSYYYIQPQLNLHLEVMTFSKLLEHATERHMPFFDKLFGK